jgi:hypothetical protein
MARGARHTHPTPSLGAARSVLPDVQTWPTPDLWPSPVSLSASGTLKIMAAVFAGSALFSASGRVVALMSFPFANHVGSDNQRTGRNTQKE